MNERVLRCFLAGVACFAIQASWAGQYRLVPIGPELPKNPFGGMIYWGVNSSAYAGNENGYGAGEDFEDYVQCIGTITTKYRWDRSQIPDPNNPSQTIDDPLDIPPAEVIAMEQCIAWAEASSVLGGVYAYSDNGLGFAPVVVSEPGYEWSHSEGTLYTKRAGGETITLTCAPSALALAQPFGATASVRYQSAIIVPHVFIEGTTRFPQPHAVKFLTG